MKFVNLHKHTCRAFIGGAIPCRRTANVLVSDGFCAYFACAPCSRIGLSARYRKRHGGAVIPAARAECGKVCEK